MSYLTIFCFQKKPPKKIRPKSYRFWNKILPQVLGLILFCTVSSSAQITFIDCECDMQPFIEIQENSGSSNDATICEGDQATITANGGDHYAWSTGSETESITVMEGGLYTVTITDTTNCQAIESVLILEYSKPFLVFDPEFCEGTSTRIQITGASSYTWGNGLMNRPLVVTESGTYSVTINDTNGCTYIETATLSKLSNPVAEILARDSNGDELSTNSQVCSGELISLEVTQGFASYAWSPVEGLSDPNGSTTTLSFTGTRTYMVTVTDLNGCTTEQSITLTISTPMGSVGGDKTVCLGESVVIEASGGVSFNWTPTDGLSDPTIATPIATPTQSTNYQVVITDINGCTSQGEVLVSVNELQASGGLDQVICKGENVGLNAMGGTTYLWSPSNGLNNVTIANPVASPESTTLYSVLITDANGCTMTDEVLVTVNEISTMITVDQTICMGESTSLVATGGTSYIWSPSEGLSNTTIANPVASPVNTTSYAVVITDSNGCSAEEMVTLLVNPLPSVSLTNDTAICPTDTIQLLATASTGISYAWSPTEGLSDPSIANPLASPTQNTTYQVTVTDANGCSAIEAVTITVFPETILQLRFFNPIFSTDSLLMCVKPFGAQSSIASLEWSPADYLTSTTDDSTFIVPNGATGDINYTVNVVDDNGCTAEESTGRIRIFQGTTNNAPAQLQVVTSPSFQASIAGNIRTESGSLVDKSDINLQGEDYEMDARSNIGEYAFDKVLMYQNYILTPSMSDRMNNGVSTLDAVLLHQHLLGITYLESPYKIIAADIDRSGELTIADIVELRKIVLQSESAQMNDASWRFIDASYVFENPLDPLKENFPEDIYLNDVDRDIKEVDFIAIKIGDLSGDTTYDQLVSSTNRTSKESVVFRTSIDVEQKSKSLLVHFFPEDLEEIAGFQFAAGFDTNQFEYQDLMSSSLVEGSSIGINEVENGIVKINWVKPVLSQSLKIEQPLFSLRFKPTKARIDFELQIKEEVLDAEAYSSHGDIRKIKLLSAQSSPTVNALPILDQNQPNPFNQSTNIRFYLPVPSEVVLKIFDNTGTFLWQQEEWYSKGDNHWIVNGEELPNGGILYYQLRTPTAILTKKMIYAR